MNKNDDKPDVFYWLLYTGAIVVAGFHTFAVFQMTDPVWVSLLAAVVVEGVVAYSAQQIGKWTNQQRKAGFFGIGLFAFISASSQLIMRFSGSGAPIPQLLHWVSLALVPLASTGTVLVLAAIKYYSGKISRETEPYGVRETRRESLENSAAYSPALPAPKEELTESAPAGESDSILAPIVELVKRKPGRPKKVAYAKDAEPGPKL